MKTPAGRPVYVNQLSPGYFHFRCEGLETILHMLPDRKIEVAQTNQKTKKVSIIFENWRAAEKAILEVFDETRLKQKIKRRKK